MNTKSSNGLLIPAHLARLITSCAQNAISEMQGLAVTLPGNTIQQMSILRALVGIKPFQASFELVPKKHRRTLGAILQGIESMEAAPLVAQTTEPGRSESELGLGLLEYAVNDFDGEQAFLRDGFIEMIDEIAKPLLETLAL